MNCYKWTPNLSPPGIGGANHRLFDGGHDLIGAWKACAAASPDDTLMQEVVGCASGLWKDFVTPKGLPIATFDKAAFDSVADTLSNLGIPRGWLADMASLTASQLAGSTIAIMAAVFAWQDEDKTRFMNLAGSLVPTAFITANPLPGVVALACLTRGYYHCHARDDRRNPLRAIASGAATSFVSLRILALFGPTGWVAPIVGLVVCVAAKIALVPHLERTVDRISENDWSATANDVVSTLRIMTWRARQLIRSGQLEGAK